MAYIAAQKNTLRLNALFLSRKQREMLIEHIDGPQPVVLTSDQSATRASLLRFEFLQFDEPASPRPFNTLLTDRGREAICIFLDAEAGLLMRAHSLSATLTGEDMLAAICKRLGNVKHDAKVPA